MSLKPGFVLAVTLAFVLVGCASEPKLPPPKEKVSFIDTTGFDRSLTSSLSANLNKVEIPVDDKVTPSAIPERLNKWLSAVDSSGGNIEVKQVDDGHGKTRAFPIAVIGLAIELVRYLHGQSAEKIYEPAANYDAEILVRQTASGERVIERVVLHRKAEK